MIRITRGLVLFAGLWLIAGASAFLATIAAPDLFLARAATHTGISIYLYLAMFVFAGFVAQNPSKHTTLIMSAYVWAASIASIAGLIGYFALVPGADELFTKFTRASGTFKDPNVFGAFIVPAAVYALHLTVTRTLVKAIVPALLLALISVAILLSFSRGAWINVAVAVGIYGYLSFVLSPTLTQRLRLSVLAMACAAAALIGVIYAQQSPDVGRLLEERASLSQSYDEGPEGRFGGQDKAKRLIADNPMGIGPLVFTEIYHVEDVHNVYLSMFLNAGWIGGFLYLMLIAITCIYGFNHALKRTATQPLFFVVYAAFVAQVLEGVVIDTDHWRHFYLLMGVVWGLMVAERAIAVVTLPRRAPRILGRAAIDTGLSIWPEPARLITALPHTVAAPARPIIVPPVMVKRLAPIGRITRRGAPALVLKQASRRQRGRIQHGAGRVRGSIIGGNAPIVPVVLLPKLAYRRQRPVTIRGKGPLLN